MTLVASVAPLVPARQLGLLVGAVGARANAVTLLGVVPLAPAAPLPVTGVISLGASGGGQIPKRNKSKMTLAHEEVHTWCAASSSSRGP